MASAARWTSSSQTVLPPIKDRTVKTPVLSLSHAAEEQDATCKPLLGYGRSLLFLVSESFEGGSRTPILGMEKYFDDDRVA